MATDIALAVLGYLLIIVGLVSTIPDLNVKRWRALNAWSYSVLIFGFLVMIASIAKCVSDAEEQRNLLAEVLSAREATLLESTRLRPTDIQVRYVLYQKFGTTPALPDVLDIYGMFGDSSFRGELVRSSQSRPAYRDTRIGHRYFLENITFENLGGHPYLHTLNGQEFRAVVDLRVDGVVSDDFELFVQGHPVKVAGQFGKLSSVYTAVLQFVPK